MPDFPSLGAFERELGRLEKSFDTAEKRRITRDQAQRAEKIADRFITRDLGSNRAFTGWRRGNPIPVGLQIKSVRESGHLLSPTKLSAGVLTTVDQGRNRGNASGFAGPGVNRRTGATSRTKAGALRKVRARKSRRWNGTTEGKGTSGDAVKAMERELPLLADNAFRRVLRKHFDVEGV